MSNKRNSKKILYHSKQFWQTMLDKYQQIQIENNILQLAVSNTNINVFKYNCSSEQICFISHTKPPFDLPRQFENGISYILEKNIINPESIDKFKQLFEQMQQGIPSASAILKIDSNGNYTWNRFILTNYLDKNKLSSHIIGTIQDITDKVIAELRYSQEEQYRLIMLSNSYRVYEINITRDKFKKLEKVQDSADYNNWSCYTQQILYICHTSVLKEDWDVFLQVADRNRLLQAFANGTTELYCEYHRINSDGTLTWSSSTTHLLRDPVSGDIKGFTYAKNIDDQKKQELLLRKQAEQDPLTGLYNRATGTKLIEQALAASSQKSTHGFLSLDIDGFKLVNDNFGHMQGDAVLKEVSTILKNGLRKDDIIARMGGDEFIIFIENISNHFYIEEVAKRLGNCIRILPIVPDNSLRISLSIGIAKFPIDGTTFTELYKNSDLALYYAKQHGKDRYMVYTPELNRKK